MRSSRRKSSNTKPRRSRPVETTTSKEAEVALGESFEAGIAATWVGLQMEEYRIVKSGPYDDFDYWVFDRDGVLIAYLEVKKRRKPLSTFGDAMFPKRKHEFGVKVNKLN